MSNLKKGITPTIAITASNRSCSFPVQLLNIKTNKLNIFYSIRKAATYLIFHHSSLQKALKIKIFIKKKHIELIK
jgi:NUMOD1 domain